MGHEHKHASEHASGENDDLCVVLEVGDLKSPTKALAMNSQKITGLGTPTEDGDAGTKAYIDGVSEGLDIKDSVRVATTEANALATDFEDGDTIDGIELATGDRVLIKDQASGAENGIYVVKATGAPDRADDMATGDGVAGAFTFIESGTVNDNRGYTCTNAKGSDVVDTDALTFSQFSGAGMVTAGDGLTKTGDTLDVVGGDGIAANADDVAVDLISDIALQITTEKLDLKLDGTTLSQTASGVKVKGLAALFEVGGVAVGANVTAPNLDELSGAGESALHKHDDMYFTETEHKATSAGAGDSGKPIKLDADGHVDATMINDLDVSHNSTDGKQGGTDAEYYHMTSAEHTELLRYKADINPLAGETPVDADVTGASWTTGDRGIGVGSLGKIFLMYYDGTHVNSVELTPPA